MFLSDESQNQNEVENKSEKKVKKNNYFDVREETAVVNYINADTRQEKEKIYNSFLKEPLDKMIDSIIRRYKLYRKGMDYSDIHSDTHSFLMTKVDKFKPAKNKKAYSYFGTICKNYLMGQILKDQKETNRKISYEDISATLENRPDMIYYMEFESYDAQKIIDQFLIDLDQYLKTTNLNEFELKLGYALIDLFNSQGDIFISNNNNKFNKNVVLFFLREITNLNTKEIRNYLKKYKVLYLETIKKKQKIINDTIEKKISLSKIQSALWEKSKSGKEDTFTLTDMDDELLQNLIKKDIDNNQKFQL